MKAISLSFLFLMISGQNFTGFAQSVYLEWVDDPLTTMVVNWVEEPGEEEFIEYRRFGAGSWSSQSGDSEPIPGTSERRYTVKLSNLDPGQAYEFRIGGTGQISKFRTAPENLDNPFRFIVAGDILDEDDKPIDYEEAKEDFVKVSEHAASSDPYFAVLGGDIAHAKGDINRVDQWLEFFELWSKNMITPDGYMIPIAAAMGNNEVPNRFGDDPDDAIFFFAFFSYPQDQWGSKISVGRLDFKKYLSIVTLDSDHTVRIPGQQTAWLNNTLQNRDDVRHVIPIYHVAGWPAFISRTLRGTQEDLVRNYWHKVFRNNRIRLVFEHHDHIYKRTHPIGDCEDQINNQLDCLFNDQAEDGVIYMGGGSWGSDNGRGAENRWYHDNVIDKIHNFVLVEITNNTRTATAIGENGTIIDQFTDVVHLDDPVPLEPESVMDTGFTARWEKVEGAESYLMEVSTKSDFSTVLDGFRNRNIGDVDSFDLSGLNPSNVYYYRVKAISLLTESDYSEPVSVQLVKVDSQASRVESNQDVKVADGLDQTEISVLVINEENEPVNNFRVELIAKEGQLLTDDAVQSTNENGVATFAVYNDRPERVSYAAIAGVNELEETVEVTYVPKAPVALSATNVETNRVQANWEVEEQADRYLLDVSANENFTNFLAGYDGLEVGNVTSYLIEGLDPGGTYFYRLRSVNGGIIGFNSQTIETVTFPEVPVAEEASEINSVRFSANWSLSEGAQSYRLDVALDDNFEDMLPDYQDVVVEGNQSVRVNGLTPNQTYFYRVRAVTKNRISENSNTITTTTDKISLENSEISSDQLKVLANGDQPHVISVLVRNNNNENQEGVEVILETDSDFSQIENERQTTDEEGRAVFSVRSGRADKVTYRALAEEVFIGEITVEFLQNEGVLKLGDNFPNPFRFQTFLPLTIPESMDVKIVVYNSLGIPVRVLQDGTMETGFYELPFDGRDLSAGVYFYRLNAAGETKVGKMLLVK